MTMFSFEEIELFLKTRGKYFENDREIRPEYGVILSITDSKDNSVIAVGVVDFPFVFKDPAIPSGCRIVAKNEVIADTNRGIRYTTIIRTSFDPWVPGQLIHTDGNKCISTNRNDTTKDNLKNLALGELSIDEIREFLKG